MKKISIKVKTIIYSYEKEAIWNWIIRYQGWKCLMTKKVDSMSAWIYDLGVFSGFEWVKFLYEMSSLTVHILDSVPWATCPPLCRCCCGWGWTPTCPRRRTPPGPTYWLPTGAIIRSGTPPSPTYWPPTGVIIRSGTSPGPTYWPPTGAIIRSGTSPGTTYWLPTGVIIRWGTPPGPTYWLPTGAIIRSGTPPGPTYWLPPGVIIRSGITWEEDG